MLGLDQVGKIYPNRVEALEAVSLTVAPGAIVAVVGGSGCGKSTLLRLVCGLDQPTAGTIRLNGTPIQAPHPRIGIVFQEPRLLPWLSVAGNVGFGLRDRPAAERKIRVRTALEQLGSATRPRPGPASSRAG